MVDQSGLHRFDFEALDRVVSRLGEEPKLRTCGGAVVVVDGDGVLYHRAFGWANHETDDPYRLSSVQNIGSLSKAFISAAVAILVSDGAVGWDDPVVSCMPDFRLMSEFCTRNLTVADLLASRTPVHWPSIPSPSSLSGYSFDEGRASVLRRLADADVAERGFRSEYHYDGGLMNVAALLVEDLSDEPYEQFVARRLLAPLGMTSTSVGPTAYDHADHVAEVYQFLSDKALLEDVPRRIDSSFMRLTNRAVPTGGVHTCANDYAKWMRFLIGRGTFEGQSLIDRQVFDRMWRPHVAIDKPFDAIRSGLESPAFVRFAYGLCWELNSLNGRLVADHRGANPGIRTRATIDLSLGLGVFVFQNSDGNSYSVNDALIFSAFDVLHDVGHGKSEWIGRALDRETVRRQQFAEIGEQFRILSESRLTSEDALAEIACGCYSGTGVNQGGVYVSLGDEGLLAEVGLYRLRLDKIAENEYMATYVSDFLGHYPSSGGEFRHLPLRARFDMDENSVLHLILTDGVESLAFSKMAH